MGSILLLLARHLLHRPEQADKFEPGHAPPASQPFVAAICRRLIPDAGVPRGLGEARSPQILVYRLNSPQP